MRTKQALSRLLIAAVIGWVVALAHSEVRATPTLTADGIALGFSLSQFADQFPTLFGVGPAGIAFPASGGVMVSDYPGDVRLFPTDTDGQHATAVIPAQIYGSQNGAGLAVSGGQVYMARQAAGDLLQLNNNGTFNQTIVTGMPGATGIVTNPTNGHLFVSTLGTNVIIDVDPIAKTKSVFVVAAVDGLTITPDGSILYGATGVGGGSVFGWNTTTGAVVFNSGFVPGLVDGVALGFGSLAGQIFVNTNTGTVIDVNLATKTQTLIVTGGSRGDLVTADPDGSLLFTQTSDIWRLTPGPGGCIGSPDCNAAVPEPGSLTMLGVGSLGFLLLHRRRRR